MQIPPTAELIVVEFLKHWADIPSFGPQKNPMFWMNEIL